LSAPTPTTIVEAADQQHRAVSGNRNGSLGILRLLAVDGGGFETNERREAEQQANGRCATEHMAAIECIQGDAAVAPGLQDGEIQDQDRQVLSNDDD
jgi:hypothetical protein